MKRAGLLLVAAALLLLPDASSALECSAISETQALAQADLVFEGVTQPGPQAPDGALLTPARLSVIRYRKGTGPSVVSIGGGPRTEGVGFQSLTGAGLAMHSGERWVVYAKGSPEGVVETSLCYGTHRSGAPAPFVSPPPGTLPSPDPNATGSAGPGFEVDPRYRSWFLWSLGGIVGLGLIMGVGYGVARRVIGTR